MLPLALTDAGWAVLGALGGALIGAVAGGSIDAFFAWRREGKLAKAGARLVAAEITGYESQLTQGEEEGKWWRFYGLEIASWIEYRDVLAVMLSQEDFEAVSQCVMVLEGMRREMPKVPEFQENPKLGFVTMKPERLRAMREEATKAYNGLSKLAGHDKESGDLILRSQPSDGD